MSNRLAVQDVMFNVCKKKSRNSKKKKEREGEREHINNKFKYLSTHRS
jgi:hypothetical protein